MSETVVEDLGSLDIIEKPVTIGGKDYIIREADGDTAAKFRGMQISHLKLTDGKASGINPGMSESELFLVSKTLYRKVPEATKENPNAVPTLVPLSVIRLWPDRITGRAFEIAQEISGLKTAETKESLLKQRAEIDKKLAEIAAKEEAGKDGEDDTKNSSES